MHNYYNPECSSSFLRALFSCFPYYVLVGEAKASITSALGFLTLPSKINQRGNLTAGFYPREPRLQADNRLTSHEEQSVKQNSFKLFMRHLAKQQTPSPLWDQVKRVISWWFFSLRFNCWDVATHGGNWNNATTTTQLILSA